MSSPHRGHGGRGGRSSFFRGGRFDRPDSALGKRGGRGGGGGDVAAEGRNGGGSSGDEAPDLDDVISEPAQSLLSFFTQLDGGPYARLNALRGRKFYLNDQLRVSLRFLTIQPDPFAPGSQVIISVPRSVPMRLTDESVTGRADVRRVAAEDFILRRLVPLLARNPLVEVQTPSQHVLERNAVLINDSSIELRIRVKIPGHGRSIDGRGCKQIIYGTVLAAVEAEVVNVPLDELAVHVDSVEDQEWLRETFLREHGLVAFVANNSILPRRSGDSDGPLRVSDGAVPFEAPESLLMSATLPVTKKHITGMALREGITLIAGGGFHGKSTLLRALELGVYNHVLSDGREFVVTRADAVKIRSEDRRSVANVDISPFITNLPLGRDTASFSTSSASGSTSQAANIVEAVEMGSRLLLIDEDTSATNFMMRDDSMKALVAVDKEPITPFTERVRALLVQQGVSTIMVVGSSGQFFSVADCVLVMEAYKPVNATERAHHIAMVYGRPYSAAADSSLEIMKGERNSRIVDAASLLRPLQTAERPKVSATAIDTIAFAAERIDLSAVEQLVEKGQTMAIALCLCEMSALFLQSQQRATEFTIRELVEASHIAMMGGRMNSIPHRAFYAPAGFAAYPRKFEVSAALNRLRTLSVAVRAPLR